MTWRLRDEEIARVLVLPGEARYSYLIKKICDEQVSWSLWEPKGWALAADDLGQELTPVWPHQAYAELCALGPWAGCAPRSIGVRDWIDLWTPGMERDHRRIAAFPTPDDRGVAVEPRRFRADLLQELSKYE